MVVGDGDLDALTMYGPKAGRGVYSGCTLPNKESRRMLAIAGGTGPFADALDPQHRSNPLLGSLLVRGFNIVSLAVKVSGMLEDCVRTPHYQIACCRRCALCSGGVTLR